MTVTCASCHFVAAEGSRFCGRCGAAFGWRCGGCGHDNPLELRYCSDCGRVAAPRGPASERRPVTVLFVDVVDSTVMAVGSDDEDFHELLTSVTGAVARAVRAAGGYVSEILGDGVVAFFGIPDAHEDDAVRAVRAALAAVAVGRSVAGASGVQLRAGIHSGTTVVAAKEVANGNVSLGALGVIPTLAARLQSKARPGEVICSEATWQLVEGYVVGEPVGPFELKGFPAAVAAWRTSGLTPAIDRVDTRIGRTPFVGRSDELSVLAAQCGRAQAGATRVVMVTGEAGIGKSRLVRAFLDGDAGVFGRIVVRGQPDQLNTPLAPVIESLELALRSWAGDGQQGIDDLLTASGLGGDEAQLITALLDAPATGGDGDIAPRHQVDTHDRRLVPARVGPGTSRTAARARRGRPLARPVDCHDVDAARRGTGAAAAVGHRDDTT